MRATSFAVPRFLVLRALAVAVLGAFLAPVASSGCGGEECTAGTIKAGDDCDKACVAGGGLLQAGVCVAKCNPAACIQGNICVGNQCQLECTTYKDCAIGVQDCLPAKQDGSEKDVLTCQSSNRAPFATPCPFGSECAAILACPNGDACDYTQCGGQACTKDDAACAGVTNCAIGLCPDGKTACTVPGCPKADCAPMTCISKGEADADAYCSTDDCKADTDCPSSFYCGIVHDSHDICDKTMDTDQEKGNNTFCGTTTDACIDPKDFSSMGHTYFEGSICLLRHACLERKQCDPCDFDGACANLTNGTCADVAGDKRCLVGCAHDSDCQPDYKCDSRKLCAPRFAGGCVGKGDFCDPCENDEDCGDKTTRKACVGASRNTHACFDFKKPIECTADTQCPKGLDGKHFHCKGTVASDNCTPATACSTYHTCEACESDDDCPTAPSGLHGHCFGTPWNGSSSSLPADECVPLLVQDQNGDNVIYCDTYKTCYLPMKDPATVQFGCW